MIRSFGLAIAAVLALAAGPALAQKPAAAIDTKIDGAAHTAGQKEVPAVAAAAGYPCTVTDGYYIGDSTAKDDKGAAVKTKIYEAACKEGLGQIYLASPTPPAKHYDCISISESPNLRCRLPGNTDPKAIVAPMVAAAGRTCAVSGVAAKGATPSGDVYFEVGCSDQLGFILKRGPDGSTTANDCAQAIGTNLECKLTTKEQIQAKTNAAIGSLVAASGKPCAVSGSRTVGTDATSGTTYYEVACGPSGGFMIAADKTGAFQKEIDCGKASGIAGGCTLTDATVAETAEAATYTRLAKAAGFPCQVSKYHYIGTDNKTASEVVELACSDRPDGGIAVLPADNSPGHVYDCVQAGALGQSCHLTSPSLVYSHYTDALRAKGKASCTVSNAHWLGHAASNNTDLIETACTDGLPGWVVEMSQRGQATDVLSCGQAKASGVQCTLPGNTK